MSDRRSFVGNVTEDFDLDHGRRIGLSGRKAHIWTDANCWLHQFIGKRVRLTVEVVPDGTSEDPIDEVATLADLTAYPIDGLHLETGIRIRSVDRVYRLNRLGERVIDGANVVGAAHRLACWIAETPPPEDQPPDSSSLRRICAFCDDKQPECQPHWVRIEDHSSGEIEILPACEDCARHQRDLHRKMTSLGDGSKHD